LKLLLQIKTFMFNFAFVKSTNKNIMKKSFAKSFVAVFFTAVMFVSITSCKPSPEKLITGKWKIDDFKTNQPIPAGMEEVFKQMMDQMKANSSFEFKADKTVIATMSGVASTGTWSVDKEGKKLTMTDNQSKKPSDANIEELTDKKLVLKMEDGGQSMTMTLVHAK
jgi:Lipocalin-like domain